jgi:hypothetical protein
MDELTKLDVCDFGMCAKQHSLLAQLYQSWLLYSSSPVGYAYEHHGSAGHSLCHNAMCKGRRVKI